jgi:beta-ribofuranosylaminobenzene 5'-phosphate synthase
MEMLPAVVEHDIESFGRSINHIQTVGFKRRELELQPFCAQLAQFMRENGAVGAGMSSFGPVVYGITDVTRLEQAVQSYLNDTVGGKVRAVKAQNTGANVREIS